MQRAERRNTYSPVEYAKLKHRFEMAEPSWYSLTTDNRADYLKQLCIDLRIPPFTEDMDNPLAPSKEEMARRLILWVSQKINYADRQANHFCIASRAPSVTVNHQMDGYTSKGVRKGYSRRDWERHEKNYSPQLDESCSSPIALGQGRRREA